MKKLLVAVALTCVTASLSFGAAACLGANGSAANTLTGTLADFMSQNANLVGCDFGDKIFSNFTYSGPLASTSINVTVAQGFGGVYQVTFVAQSPGSFQSTATLGFDVQVDTAAFPFARIVQNQDQINSGTINPPPFVPNTSSASITHTMLAGGVGPTTSPISLNGTSFGTETAQTDIFSLTSERNTATLNPNGAQIFSLEIDLVQSAVPEPMTMSLMGFGLLAVGAFARRVKK